MSTAGPSQGAAPVEGEARAARFGGNTAPKGRPEALAPLRGEARGARFGGNT